MTGVQSRDESVGDTSDDEPLSKMVKPDLDLIEDTSQKKTPNEPTSTTQECPEHSSDSEPLTKPLRSKGAKHTDKEQETAEMTLSDSEDNQPLTVIIKKRKKQKEDPQESEDAKKTRIPKKRKAATKASKLRESSPSPSPSPVKVTQRRGRKAKDNSKKKISAQSPSVNMTPKRRGQAKKERKAQCSDSSDEEKLSGLARKKGEPEMKQAVVLLERMSEREFKDAVARGRSQSEEQKDGSSDDEPLVRMVKTPKAKEKFRKRANGEEDTVKQDKDLSEEDERPN